VIPVLVTNILLRRAAEHKVPKKVKSYFLIPRAIYIHRAHIYRTGSNNNNNN
jgi:hypothetical protein